MSARCDYGYVRMHCEGSWGEFGANNVGVSAIVHCEACCMNSTAQRERETGEKGPATELKLGATLYFGVSAVEFMYSKLCKLHQLTNTH